MAIRNVVKEGDDVLRKTARPVIEFGPRLHTLLDDMAETMYATNGVGLAANQVGILRRVVVIDVGEGLIELVNPEIVKKSGNQQEVEGCLSSPGEYGITSRPMKVKVEAFDRFGNPVSYEGEGLLARAFCHELDHLDGVLFKDNVIRMLSPEEIGE
ncbi:MAG: peptide deformylase [Ruminococcus sp.]|nr:peptide deformylase [Ruminococcus sp.]